MSRGHTLIELMITVAILGILAAGAIGAGTATAHRQTGEVIQRERAQQVLEYEASALMRGEPDDPALRAALLQELKGATLQVSPAGEGLWLLSVRWELASGHPAERTLLGFGRRP